MRTVCRLIGCYLGINENVRTEMLCMTVSYANVTVFTYLYCGACTSYFVVICSTMKQKGCYANIFLCDTAENSDRCKTISAETYSIIVVLLAVQSVCQKSFPKVEWSFIIRWWLHGYPTLSCCLRYRTPLCSRIGFRRYVDREGTEFSVTH